MAYHNILSKTDRALVAFLISEAAGTADNIVPSKRSLSKELPVVICFTESAKLEAEYPANYRVSTSVIVKTPVLDDDDASGVADSEALQAAVFDCFKKYITDDSDDSALAEQISIAARAAAVSDPTNNGDLADFTCQRVMDKGQSLMCDEEGTYWSDTLNLELIVCPKNVS
jgi:hypothetical protein